MDFSGKQILVIGATGALGSEFVRQLGSTGARVIGTAKTAESAERIPSVAALRLLLDLENQDSIDAVVDYLNGQYASLDGIVLAAGLVGFGSSQETTVADSVRLMQVNYLNQLQAATRLLPLLQKSSAEGRFIVGISGVVAEKSFPGMLAYAASKAALSSALKSLHLEVRRQGISVIDARPGHTETGLAQRAAFGTAPAFATGMAAEHVVATILNAVNEGKTEVASADF